MKPGRLLLFAGLVLAASAQTFPVAGVIIDAQSGSPMRGVRIALSSAGSQLRTVSVVTGDSGYFSFDAPPGRYVLRAERRGLRQTYGIGGPGLGFGVAIITGSDQDTGHLTFRWYPPGAITGMVVDDRGEPVERALVQLIRSSISGGHKRVVTAGWFWTDDRGIYRIAPLTAGSYYVAVTAEPWYAERVDVPGTRNPADKTSDPVPAYAPNYYPEASDLSGAAVLVVKPGGEIHANFTLRTIAGVRVQVHCPASAGRTGTLSLLAEGREGARGFQREVRFYGSGQTIAGVPPGRYDVRLRGNSENPFLVQKSIEVANTDVTVELALQSPPSVRGRVTFAGSAASPKSNVYVRLVGEAGGGAYARALERDGSFVFSDVAAGKYRPRISGAEGFQIAQFSVDGASFKDGVLEVSGGETITLNLVADDETGHVKGFAVDGEKPAPGILVVIAPRKESSDNPEYQGFQTDSDGSFDFASVRAGDYVLFAVANLELEYASPEAVRPYLASGKALRVERSKIYTERVPVDSGRHN